MDALRIEHAALVGNSMAGGIAHAIATTRHERISAFVLEGAVGYQPARERFWVFRLWSVRRLGKIVMASLTPFAVRSLLRRCLYFDPDRVTNEFVRRYAATLRAREGRAAAPVPGG